jgi:transposase
LAGPAAGSAGGHERGRAREARQDVDCGCRGQWLCDRAVDLGAHRQADQTRIWPCVQHRACLAGRSRAGILQPAPHRAGARARRGGDQELEDQALAGAKKNARAQGRTIVFVDESGLSERPTRVKTWAPKGCTPTLQYSFNWKQLSLIAGASFWRIYFRFFYGAIKGPQLVEFLKALRTQIKGKLLIIWDGLPAHRSRLVRDYVDSLEGDIVLERLPGYAPELNPVEYLFGYAKQRELANLCLDTIDEVRRYATRRLRSMQRRPTLVRAFWQQAELPI